MFSISTLPILLFQVLEITVVSALAIYLLRKFNYSSISSLKLYSIYTIIGVLAWSIYNIFIMGPVSGVQFVPAGFGVIILSPLIIPIILCINYAYINGNSNIKSKGKAFAKHIGYTILWIIGMIILISLLEPITNNIAIFYNELVKVK